MEEDVKSGASRVVYLECVKHRHVAGDGSEYVLLVSCIVRKSV